MTMKRIGGRVVTQGASGLRVDDFEVSEPGLAAELGTTKKTKFPGQRMLPSPESDPH
jgi:hypothetical protein